MYTLWAASEDMMVPPFKDLSGHVLTIRTLGVPVFSNGSGSVRFARRKSAALLVYLAVTRRTHTRDALANLLWGEFPQERATANLRKALAELREHVGEAVAISGQTIAVNPDYPVALDMADFDADVARGLATDDPRLLARAAETYRDDFLAGFSPPAADAFDEWALLYRAYLRERLIVALDALSAIYTDRGDDRAALGPARRILALDPWREEAHRRVMILLTRTGNRAAAIAQFLQCRQMLATELGVEPMSETTALFRRLRDGTGDALT